MSDLYDAFEPSDSPLNHELTPIISALLRRPFLTEESDPDIYRRVRLREKELPAWFQSNLGWHVKTSEFGRYVRLFKRRELPPADRCALPGPGGGPSSPLVLVLLCLISEQLWRRPEVTYSDLQREVTRVCASESVRDALPQFQVVTEAGESRARADQHRRAFVEALQMLEHWHVIRTDRPLASRGTEVSSDVVITCEPERLNDFLAVTAISQMPIDIDQPQTHVAVLCQDQQDLPGHASESQQDLQRRHRALRAVLDDAAIVLDGERAVARYLTTSGGRRQALQTALTAGLTCVVRREVWLTCDAERASTDLDFPQPRSIGGQAALLLVHWLRSNGPQSVTSKQCAAVIEQAMADNTEWAKTYRSAGALRTLVRDALATLTSAGILTRSNDDPPTWATTGAHAYWRVHISSVDRLPEVAIADDDLFAQDGFRD